MNIDKYQLYFKDPKTGEFIELKGHTMDSLPLKNDEEKNIEEYYIGLLEELDLSDEKYKEVSKDNTNYARVHGKGILLYNASNCGETGFYTNLEDIIFNDPTDDWGNIKAIGIFKEENCDELFAYKILSSSHHKVLKGDVAPRILKGQLKF